LGGVNTEGTTWQTNEIHTGAKNRQVEAPTFPNTKFRLKGNQSKLITTYLQHSSQGTPENNYSILFDSLTVLMQFMNT
jgi:hypothetical protein